MLGRRAKVAVLVLALLVLAVEGVLLVRHYDRYYGSDAASGNAASSVPAFERTTPERTTPERTTPERTAPEATASTGEASPKANGTVFVHRATARNSRSNYTYLSDPRTNGDPDAVVLVAPSPGRGAQAGADYGHNVGVWFEFGKEKWAIFNQDLAAIPAGSAFEVIVPPAGRRFVHRAGPEDTFGNTTYLNDPLLDGNPDAEVSVTQNWNPGGGGGVYNDHPVGVLYDGDAGSWFIYNEDGARMPEGAAFNVAVSGAEPVG